MKISAVFLFAFCFCTSISSAQETRKSYLGIETGLTFIAGEMPEMDFVRAEIPSYTGGTSDNNLTSIMSERFIGIKNEYFSLNGRLGVSGGLRVTWTNSSIGKNGYALNSQDFFYMLYREDGINTEYLKVKEINQTTDYIGLPVEARYFLFAPQAFRLYVKLGAVINYRLNTKTNAVFKDDAMEPYQNDVTAFVRQPGSFSSAIYAAAGVRLGGAPNPAVSLEVCLPYLFLTSGSAGLLNPAAGTGLQLNAQIPFKTKMK